ncbi:hypothetical protein ARMGADRAFT_1071412 [Armillaria gallica]|uniref:Uncharacterized protein n=1 Tax=Armillaria gallica TaxID=47427 RepID=A0A2H3EM90_ARMGA|nr:hypothetical protein ARMGADRAFT_1071412 [Armillaria gallica]
MEDIAASASKENPELFRSASVRGQPSFLPTPLVLLHQMTFHVTKGLVYLTDIKRTWIHTPAPEPTSNGRQPVTMESDDSRSETDTSTHATNQHNHGDKEDNSQPGSPNEPEGPGGPNGPGEPDSPSGPEGPGSSNGPRGLGKPGNNPPNEQDFLWEFMNLLHRVSTLLNNP